MNSKNFNRRAFLASSGIAAAAFAGIKTAHGAEVATPAKPRQAPFKLGIASYTFRQFDLAQTLAMTQQVNITQLSLKSMHLSLDSTAEQIAAVVEQVREAGITLYGGGVIYMKNEQQVQQAFDYAKMAGFTTIIGVPSHELLGLVERKVKETNIKVAIHNHGPGDLLYPTAESIMDKVHALDSRIGICLDIGHTMRSGVKPQDDIIKYQKRLHDLHLKDVTKAEKAGSTTEMGRGVIDIPQVIRALFKINYSGIASFEFEKDGKSPLAGLAESVGYTRGIIDTLIK